MLNTSSLIPFAAEIVNLSKASDKVFSKQFAKKLKEGGAKTPKRSTPDLSQEVNSTLSKMKNWTVAGANGIEFLKHSGSKVKEWLAWFYSDIVGSGKFPSRFKRNQILPLLKPNKFLMIRKAILLIHCMLQVAFALRRINGNGTYKNPKFQNT